MFIRAFNLLLDFLGLVALFVAAFATWVALP
jgi:hypothetical protein